MAQGDTPRPSTVRTLVFTDIEGSTRLWLEQPEIAASAVTLHDETLTAAFERHGGRVIKSLGDGVLAVFDDPAAAIRATAAGQHALAERKDQLSGAASVRMAIHVGSVEERNGDLLGLEVTRCQRIMSTAHGGQILLSSAALETVGDPPAPFEAMDLGRYRLKSLDEPEQLFQLSGPGLARRFPPLDSVTSSAHNLPAQPSTFVGRVQELAVLDKLIRGSRLVTLTGEGGVGKTRLALEAAGRLRGEFRDGIWLVELEEVRDDALVAPQVATTLGLVSIEGSAMAAAVAHLAPRETLLVFDNCERVVPGTGDLVRRLLAAAPGLRIMTTSRERLAIPGESLYRVPPMPVPSPDSGPELAGRFDSVRLFSERAELGAPGFRLSDRTVEHVVSVCRRLDGIPLAIELAAAKVGILTIDQIATGLSDRLALLDSGRTGAGRHRTLRAAAEWSFDLLDQADQTLFLSLSVFRGGFDSAAVTAVTGKTDTDALAGLVSLADKSMVRREPGKPRFRMLEPLRHFAAERCEEVGIAQALSASHADHFAQLADRAFTERRGADLDMWLDRLDAEHANLMAAFEWALEHDLAEIATRISLGTATLWKHRGHADEGRQRLERALARTSDGAILAHAHLAAGDLAADVGDTNGARRHLMESRRLGLASGDHDTEAWTLARLASIAHKEADLNSATELFMDALESARRGGNDLVLGHILASLSLLLADRGDVDRARSMAAEAVERSRSSGNPYAIADALLTESEIALNFGDQHAGRVRAGEALDLGRQVGLGDVTAWSLNYLGKASLLEGELRKARSLLEEALERFEESGTPLGRPWTLRHLAIARWLEGSTQAARSLLSIGLADATTYVLPDVPLLLEVSGWVLSRPAPEAAARLLGCAAAQRQSLGLSLPPFEAAQHESAVTAIVGQIGSRSMEAAFDQGTAMDVRKAPGLVDADLSIDA